MTRVFRVVVSLLVCSAVWPTAEALAQSPNRVEYRVLATAKTSTMEKELNEAADAGFRFLSVMGGETSGGGKEVVTVMGRSEGNRPRYQYKLIATNRTSTMQRELQEAADQGFEYIGQTVFESMFGGKEVVSILQRDSNVKSPVAYEYRLLATKKTSTLEKELQEAGDQGFTVLGMTVGKTLVGGTELVAITRRVRR
jgi:hypothetical protein